jgi:hypothetical protein
MALFFGRAPPADGWGRRLMMMIMRVESVEQRPGWGEHFFTMFLSLPAWGIFGMTSR